MKSLPYFLATCFLPLAHATATCYNQDGTSQDSISTPCNNETSFSSCCRTQETCLPNGLCENVEGGNGTEITTYFREGCTDPSWNSPACLTPFNICPTEGNDSVKSVEVTPCPNDTDTFCCGSNNTVCCDSNPITLAAEAVAGTSSATSSTSTSTSTSTATPTTIALSTPTTTPKLSSPASPLSPGAKAGIAVASVAVAIVLAALLFYILSRRRCTGGPTSYLAGASSEATMVGSEIQAISGAPPYRDGDNTEERGSSPYVKSRITGIEQPVREDEGNAMKYEDHRKFRRFSNDILRI